jgi:transposase-like protein
MKEEILKRMAAGDSIRQIARDFGIGEATLRRNFSTQAPQVKELATTRAKVEIEMARLPVSAQRAVISLTEQIKSIQNDYASVAAKGARTANAIADLAGRVMAGEQVEPRDIANAAVAAELHKAANVALVPAQAMVTANKGKDQEQAKSLEDLLDEANRMGRPA